MSHDFDRRRAVLSEEQRTLLDRRLRGMGGRETDRINPRSDPGPAPLSFAQQRLWFLDRLAPGTPLYNIHSVLRLDFPLDVEALQNSLTEISRRHEVLRTRFEVIEGRPTQVPAPLQMVALPVCSCSAVAFTEREAWARRLILEEICRPFQLDTGPVFRALLLRLGEKDHLFVLTLHHIVSDEWSMGILFQELTAIYSAFTRKAPSQLAEPELQYADYAVWQRARLSGAILETQLSYWRNQLKELTPLVLTTDHPRPTTPSFRGDYLETSFALDLERHVRQLAQSEGVTLFMVLLTAFKVLLHRYTGQDDIVVGTAIAGRNRAEIESLVGFFVNTLVLRTDLSGNPSYRELLRRVRQTAVSAYSHQDIPFEMLVEKLQPERNLSRNPLFQVAFQVLNTPGSGGAETTVRPPPLQLGTGTAKFDLTLSLRDNGRSMEGWLEYNTDLFERTTMTRLLEHFRNLLEGIVANPDARLAEVPMLSHAERDQELASSRPQAMGKSRVAHAHELFEAWAERRPKASAVVFGGEIVSYGELNKRANRLAHRLMDFGVGPESRVGLCLSRSPRMIEALLGVLKAGAAYVPLDPTYPMPRLDFMLEHAHVSLIVTERSQEYGLPSPATERLYLDEEPREDVEYHNPRLRVCPENLAYVIYTSGSTGQPKGVAVEHRGLGHLIAQQREVFGVFPESRVLQFASLSFDASLFEILMALGSGATLCLANREENLLGPDLLHFLSIQGITIVTLPPSALTALPFAALPALRTITVAGEACDSDLVKRWAPGRRFFNLYGPTEATIWATFQECMGDEGAPPIGCPLAHTEAYVLDRQMQLLPRGVPGELYLGGVGLARGYLHRPDLTAERFVPNPFGLPGDRLYRTGDFVRRNQAGALEFIGRVDHQVKVRGYRIELGEIESTLRSHPGVKNAIVIVRADEAGHPALAGYIVAEKHIAVAVESLRVHLRERLPAFMIPASLTLLAELPTSPNGKIDRNSLPSPADSARSPQCVEPQTQMEKQLLRIWQQVLRRDGFGIHDNFFDIGGQSLLMVEAHAAIQGFYGQELSLIDLFRHPTIHTLARHLEQSTQNTVDRSDVRERAARRAEVVRQERFRRTRLER